MKKTPPLQQVALLVLVTLFALPAWAQPTYTLVISDGEVRVNDNIIAPDNLPESLELRGLEGIFSFSGYTAPIIQLGDHYYQIEADALRLVDDQISDGVRVYFRNDGQNQPPGLRRYEPGSPYLAFLSGDSLRELAPARQFAALMEDQANQLSQLSEQVLARDIAGNEALAQDLMIRAEQANLVAQELPSLELKSYLADVEQRDQVLYQRLIREQRMEYETRRLANRIRIMRPSQERDALIAELEEMLDEIFEIKQQNRRDEIAQLEVQLNELNRLLREREAMRNRIISRRAKELVGN